MYVSYTRSITVCFINLVKENNGAYKVLSKLLLKIHKSVLYTAPINRRTFSRWPGFRFARSVKFLESRAPLESRDRTHDIGFHSNRLEARLRLPECKGNASGNKDKITLIRPLYSVARPCMWILANFFREGVRQDYPIAKNVPKTVLIGSRY